MNTLPTLPPPHPWHPRFRALAFLCLLSLPFCSLAAPPAPPLPPGVRLEPLAAPRRLSVDYHAEMLAVDWTHPLLRVGLEEGLAPGATLPLAWAQAEKKNPGALRIQLVEPLEGKNNVWSLALPAHGAAALGRLPHACLGEPGRWLLGGPLLDAEPELTSTLEPGGPLVAARWLGRAEELDAITSLTFPSRCLVSWTNPASGQSRFALVVRSGGRTGQIGEIKNWLWAEARPGEWLAIHSMGEGAIAGAGAWRLTEPSPPRRAERLGAALTLSSLAAGDAVDWARLAGCSVQACSSEIGYPPENLLRGLFWPNPLMPPVWISAPLSGAGEVPWVELTLDKPRQVKRVVLAWASAAGWTEQFNPRRVRLLGATEPGRNAELKLLDEIKDPAGPLTTWTPKAPLTLSRLRVELPVPSAMVLDRRARLAALQLWGPWDGTTQPLTTLEKTESQPSPAQAGNGVSPQAP